jgi:hypothetical protein
MRSIDYNEIEMQEIENRDRDLDEMETLQLDNPQQPLLSDSFVPAKKGSYSLTFSSVIRGIFTSTVDKHKHVIVHTTDLATQCVPFQPYVPYPLEEV